MGTMMRRLRQNDRRRLGELVDKILDWLDCLDDEAYDLRDAEALAWCREAASQILETLTDDGKPTHHTRAVLLEAVAGPLARAMARLRPDLPLPPGADVLVAE